MPATTAVSPASVPGAQPTPLGPEPAPPTVIHQAAPSPVPAAEPLSLPSQPTPAQVTALHAELTGLRQELARLRGTHPTGT